MTRDTVGSAFDAFEALSPDSLSQKMRSIVADLLCTPNLRDDIIPTHPELYVLMRDSLFNEGELLDWALPHAVHCCVHSAAAGSPELLVLYLCRIMLLRFHLANFEKLTT